MCRDASFVSMTNQIGKYRVCNRRQACLPVGRVATSYRDSYISPPENESSLYCVD